MARVERKRLPRGEDEAPPSEEFAGNIRGQLQRILSSQLFSRSPQAAHLLTFLVEETLAPSGANSRNNLKEYSIAVRVFGRAASFDPGSDNIVRVEVRRVRSKLENYYAEEGASDPILISIPKGSYAPLFQTRDDFDVDLSGRIISHYELVRRRCSNRWQTTYDANCLHLQRSVTVILPTRVALENEGKLRSLLEGTRGRGVDHPNVAALHDVETTDRQVIIVAAGLPGRSLREVVDQGTLSNEEALRFACELAAAVAAGHQVGAFHGNLNPESVTLDDTSAHVQILPFGISPLVDIEDSTFEGFRPPEWRGGIGMDLRSDVWSFGALVWFACYGSSPPPSTDTSESLTSDRVPIRLGEVLRRCLQADPRLRYANAQEILEDVALISKPVVDKVDEEPPKQRPTSHKVLSVTALLLAVLIIAVAFSIRLRQEQSGVTNPRVIVLPFENLGNDPENEPYCRAVAELLAASLGRVPGLYLVSSRSLGQVKTDQLSTRFLQEQLRVDYVVDGSLLKTESRFQASVRLISVADGGYAWSNNYSGPWTDLSGRMEEMADKAALAMGLAVQRAETGPPSKPAVNVTANDAWLKGRFSAIEYWNTLVPAHFEGAERRLLRALELQPGYVDAMVDLGQLYLSAAYPPKGNQRDLFDKAQKLAEDAVTLDPESGRAHTLLGSVYTDTGRSLLAMPHLLRGLKLSPHDPNPYNSLSLAYEAMGFWESGLFERERALERDPLLRGIQTGRAMLLARLGRVDEALRVADTFKKGSPAWGTLVARVHLLTNDPKQAEAVLIKTNTPDSSDPSTPVEALLAVTRAAQGHPEVAKVAVRQLRSPERQRGVYFAMLCALAGDKDLLVDDIAHHIYARNYRWVVSEPLLRPYRDYPPFKSLVHDLYEEWQRNLDQLGPSLPVQPPKLPDPDQYLSQR